MLHAAVLLDLAVAAMVVCKDQTFCRDKFSGATSAEQHDSILEGCLVDAVDVLGAELEAFALHILDTL